MARESIETGSRTLAQMSGALSAMNQARQIGIEGIQRGIDSFANILLSNHARIQRQKEQKRAEEFRQKEFDFNKAHADRMYNLGVSQFQANKAAQAYANKTARINANSNAAMTNERIRMTNNPFTRLANDVAYENLKNEALQRKAAQNADNTPIKKPLSSFFE